MCIMAYRSPQADELEPAKITLSAHARAYPTILPRPTDL